MYLVGALATHAHDADQDAHTAGHRRRNGVGHGVGAEFNRDAELLAEPAADINVQPLLLPWALMKLQRGLSPWMPQAPPSCRSV